MSYLYNGGLAKFNVRRFVFDPSIATNNESLLEQGLDFLHAWGSKGRVDPSKKKRSWIFLEGEKEEDDDEDEEDEEDEDEDDEEDDDSTYNSESDADSNCPRASITGGAMLFIEPCRYEYKVSSRIFLFNRLKLSRSRGRGKNPDRIEVNSFDAVGIKGMSTHNLKRRFLWCYGLRRLSRPRRDKRHPKTEDFHIMYVDIVNCLLQFI